MNYLIKKISQSQNYSFFVLLSFLNLFLVFSVSNFVTLDGLTHLYSANVLMDLLKGDSFFSNYFLLNKELLPNWTGHFLLGVFSNIFNFEVSHKIIQTIIIFGLPISFRYFLSRTTKYYQWSSFLIFPFTYGIHFLLGLYTFLIAVILAFFILGKYHNFFFKKFSLNKSLILTLWLILLYFTHLIMFGLVLIVFAVEILAQFLAHYNQNLKGRISAAIVTYFHLIMVSAIPLIFAVIYYSSRTAIREIEYFGFQTIIKQIYLVQPVISFNQEYEERFTLFLGLFFILLLVMFIRFLLIQIRHKRGIDKNLIFHLLNFVMMLFIIFIVPDSDGYGWSATVRFILLGFLFFIALISNIQLPKSIKITGVTLFLVIHIVLVGYAFPSVKGLNKCAKEVINASKTIEDYSVVLPINKTSNWLKSRMHNLLSVNRPILILENYQASLNYFPIKWDENNFPNLLLGGMKNDFFECLTWRSAHSNQEVEIDYIFFFEPENLSIDSCWNDVMTFFDSEFQTVSQDKNYILYKKLK